MPGAKKNFIGLEGFIWWLGVVEDRQDPEQLGRVRVRCFGWHTEDKNKIPTDALPWAHPMMPVNNPAAYTPKEGDMVMGFFMDGENAQNPVIMGVLPGKPVKKPDYAKGFADPRKSFDVKKPGASGEAYPLKNYIKEPTLTRLSRNKPDDTVIATRKKNKKSGIKSAGGVTWSEPNPAFAPKYPYNNALETESGHAFELDDTPNQERVHLAHRKGSFFEIDKDGSKVEKVVKDNYTLIMGDDFIYVKGKAAITVDGNFNLKTSTINIEAAAINMAASGDIKIKGKNVNIEATSAMNFKAGSAGNFTAGAKLSLKGATAALAGATVDIPAGKINMQSGSASSASGAGISGGGTSAAGETPEEAAASGNATPAVANTTPATPTSNSAAASAQVGKVAAVGKTVGNLTSSVSDAVSKVSGVLDNTLKDLASSIPLGEMANKLGDAAAFINETKGDILSITDKVTKDSIFNKIESVATQAASKNLDFTIDQDITAAIDHAKNKGVGVITTVLGKHVYPKTESVVVSANT
jgi:Gp5 N-terminal OB domain